MDNVELTIRNGQTLYYPSMEEGINWETERKSSPGKLTFNVIGDTTLNIEEGNLVTFKVGDTNVFWGYIFTIKMNKDTTIKITAYDQLRYLKSKHSMVYRNSKANEVIKLISDDFKLKTGLLEDTEYIFDYRIEDNTSPFDIIETALSETTRQKKKIYVLYDNFGELTLKNIENMKLPLLYDNDTSEDFDYTSSIDSNTYNRIKIAYDNKETGKREIYTTEDSGNMSKWGVLQYYEKVTKVENAKSKGAALLYLYNKKSKDLTLKNAIGDLRVRAGVGIYVKLDLEYTQIEKCMLVEKAKHTFKNGEHFMDLTLKGDLYMKSV